MKKMVRKYRGLVLLTGMFIFSLHINAVFEGRNEKLQEYSGVRNQVEMSPMGNQVATLINPGDGSNNTPNNELQEDPDPMPFYDSSLFILVLCSLISGVYYQGRRKRVS